MNRLEDAQEQYDAAKRELEALLEAEKQIVEAMEGLVMPGQNTQERVTCANCGTEFAINEDNCPKCRTPRPPDLPEVAPVTP